MPLLHSLLRCRLLIVAWLIIWVTSVPLYHIHIPDNTDRWSALQGGAHTVFTPDLPGEFSPTWHDVLPGHFGHLSQRAVHSPELGIAIFNDKSEDQKAKQLHSLCIHYHAPTTLLSSWPFECSGTYRGAPLSHAFPAFRAPPRILCA